jgi:phosphoribosylanthranilate isomerase
VKICGLTRPEDVDNAVNSGADAVGFIFGYGNSPRNVSFENLARLVARVPPYVSSVVVSPSENPDLAEVSSEVKPTFYQLYSEDGSLAGGVDPSVLINTVHVNSDSLNLESIIQRSKILAKSSKGIILDSVPKEASGKSLPGGTGATHDWNSSRKIRDALYPFPIILGGGLNPKNVQRAIEIVMPFAVDVSSGVESKPGIKDDIKVRDFIQNAKAAARVDY